jgi:hypothetical protein
MRVVSTAKRLTASRIVCAGLIECLVACLLGGAAAGFRNVDIGARIPNPTMTTLAGKKEPLLGDAVTVIVFFRPTGDYSNKALVELAKCQKTLVDKPLRWVGVTSDVYSKRDVAAMVKEVGFKGSILLDEGDELYGTFGVRLLPVVAIVNPKHELAAEQVFRKINFHSFCEGRILFALGELTEAELNERLNPERFVQGGDEAKADRMLRLAAVLAKKKSGLDKAQTFAEQALATAPNYAPAKALLALILSQKEECARASKLAGEVLAVEPDSADAAKARGNCGDLVEQPETGKQPADEPKADQPKADEPKPKKRKAKKRKAKKRKAKEPEAKEP